VGRSGASEVSTLTDKVDIDKHLRQSETQTAKNYTKNAAGATALPS
jgi:hypothetical protein